MKEIMKAPVMVDLRNIFNPADMLAAGFRYSSLGRPQSVPGE
jgi:UDPglucose 6-dehydrogenase